MTNEEALKRFKWKYNLAKDYNDPHWEGGERREHSEWVEQLEIAINALEKQIPKKPKEIIVIDRKSFACPRCNEILHSYLQSYCADCGQALDWSDSE